MSVEEILKLIIASLAFMCVAGTGVWVRMEIRMSKFETLLTQILERRRTRNEP